MTRDSLIEAAMDAAQNIPHPQRPLFDDDDEAQVLAVVDAIESLVRADERQQMERQAATVIATRTVGRVTVRISDPHEVGWTPISLDLLRDLVTQVGWDVE